MSQTNDDKGLVTAEDRAKELEAQKDFEILEKQLDQKDELEQRKFMSVRKRLEQRLKEVFIKVNFKDQAGEYSVKAPLASPDDLFVITDLYNRFVIYQLKVKDIPVNDKAAKKLVDEGQKLMKELYQMAGKYSELGAHYFKIDKHPLAQPLKILMSVITASSAYREDLDFFRDE